MNYYSITVDFKSSEPWSRDNLDGLVREFVDSLRGEVTATTIYIDEEADQ